MRQRHRETIAVLAILSLSMVAVGIMVGALAPSVAASSGSEIVVDPDPNIGDANTTQEGINMAGPDDTVIVNDGTYEENVVVNKSITVVAGGDNVVFNGTNADDEPAFLVENQSASLKEIGIDGFTIENYTDTAIAVRDDDLTELSIATGSHAAPSPPGGPTSLYPGRQTGPA